MYKYLLFFIFFSSTIFFAQTDNSTFVGTKTEYQYINGQIQQRTITVPKWAGYTQENITPAPVYQNSPNNNSDLRWSFTEPVSIGSKNAVSGIGQYVSVGWDLNAERISLYGNTNNTPVWEYTTSTSTNVNNVSFSDTGGVLACASYQNAFMFNTNNSSPVFDFNVTTLPITNPETRAMDITNNGKFAIVGTFGQTAGDSNFVLGFSKDSTQAVWKFKVGQTAAGGSAIQGIKICAYDSLAIVNTYGAFYVIRTYTGEILYTGMINPSSPSSGTQSIQAISGNGNYVATINYSGYVRLYQRSGNTYNFLWQHQEPPGAYYNWMYAVDLSTDGQYLACGTMNFVSSSSYDGKVKLFRTSNSTPIWTFPSMGERVMSVAFSKNGNVLAACGYGDINNQYNDIYVWKISTGNNLPIYGFNGTTSPFWCSISNDGSTLVASGKAVHAVIMGWGGCAYNFHIDTNDAPVGVITGNNEPYEYSLKQNYPNPFNPSTQIDYVLAKDGNVKISVYDVMGREVSNLVNAFQRQGKHSVSFDASKITSGVYFYKIESGDFKDTKKMILIK